MTARELAVVRDRVARARLERAKPRPIVVVREPAPAQKAGAIRYATDEERREARQRTFRESRRRLHGVCPECGGRKAPHHMVKMCRRCYLAAVEPPHGTVTRYVSRRFKCRCEECKTAASSYHRERRQRMRDWRVAA